MKITVICFVLMSAIAISAQADARCHAYLVNVSEAVKANQQGRNCSDESKCGVTTFPEFKPTFGEEELTTKAYKFPGGDLTITASVLMTDESLRSSNTADSILTTITLSKISPKDVLATEDSAQAEFTLLSNGDALRVKRYYKLAGKEYLVGLECHVGKLDKKAP